MAKRPVPKYDFKAFGAAIKAAREGCKESRKKVGDEMFISPRYLANIENKGQHPSLQIFFELIQRYHTNRYGEIEPKQEAALEELGFELPNPEKKRSKTNNRKVVFDSACRTMFLDICKRHGLEIDEEPSYGGRQYLEKQDYIRMKQKEEIAVQQEMLNQQRDKVNANHLELARQSNHVRANEKVIQSQKEKIEQQEKEFKENFISNSDRILSQGELIEEQREELQQLTLRIEDVETLLDEVSSEAYDKAVDIIVAWMS